LISACQLAPVSDSGGKQPAQTPSKPPQISVKEQKINQLLANARSAFEANRLTTPVDDNAYLRYGQVLALDPNNSAALLGLTEIVEQYLAWAMDHLTAGDLGEAKQLLGRARSVDPQHPNLPAVQQRLDEKTASTQINYPLDTSELNNRTDRMIGRLLEIGRDIERRSARIVITARSDAEGRWIYQRLNEASLARVRGIFQIDDIPSVKLIFSQDNVKQH